MQEFVIVSTTTPEVIGPFDSVFSANRYANYVWMGRTFKPYTVKPLILPEQK